MVSINYQTFGKGFNLRLRIYQDGETKFINVTKRLQGNLQKKHWNQKMKCFYNSAPFSQENNEMLLKFSKPYRERAESWTGSLDGFIASFVDGETEKVAEDRNIDKIISILVDEMKAQNVHEDGTLRGGYEEYEKLQKRLRDFCNDRNLKYDNLTIDDMTPGMVTNILNWCRNRGAGKCVNISATLRAILNKLSKRGLYDFEQVRNCNWIKKERCTKHKYYTLSDEQFRRFATAPIEELPYAKNASLFRDFCVFIVYTCQSVCDAVALKYDNIKYDNGQGYFVFKRRKIEYKQANDCYVPINQTMSEIMKKWKPHTKDGYVFPIRSIERMRKSKVNNGDIKSFLCKLNAWLKECGEYLGCDFVLHTYVFRHTGITRHISNGASIAFVSNLAGTDDRNITQIYYNNRADVKSIRAVLAADKF